MGTDDESNNHRYSSSESLVCTFTFAILNLKSTSVLSMLSCAYLVPAARMVRPMTTDGTWMEGDEER
jgi:hypothetical protein